MTPTASPTRKRWNGFSVWCAKRGWSSAARAASTSPARCGSPKSWARATPSSRSSPTPARATSPSSSTAVFWPRRGCRSRRGCSVLLDLGDVAFGEEVSAHVLVECLVHAPQVFEAHDRVLDLLVAVVLEDAPELLIGRGLSALVVPVDRLQLLLHRLHRAREVERLFAHLRVVLVPLSACCHWLYLRL